MVVAVTVKKERGRNFARARSPRYAPLFQLSVARGILDAELLPAAHSLEAENDSIEFEKTRSHPLNFSFCILPSKSGPLHNFLAVCGQIWQKFRGILTTSLITKF